MKKLVAALLIVCVLPLFLMAQPQPKRRLSEAPGRPSAIIMEDPLSDPNTEGAYFVYTYLRHLWGDNMIVTAAETLTVTFPEAGPDDRLELLEVANPAADDSVNTWQAPIRLWINDAPDTAWLYIGPGGYFTEYRVVFVDSIRMSAFYDSTHVYIMKGWYE